MIRDCAVTDPHVFERPESVRAAWRDLRLRPDRGRSTESRSSTSRCAWLWRESGSWWSRTRSCEARSSRSSSTCSATRGPARATSASRAAVSSDKVSGLRVRARSRVARRRVQVAWFALAHPRLTWGGRAGKYPHHALLGCCAGSRGVPGPTGGVPSTDRGSTGPGASCVDSSTCVYGCSRRLQPWRG